MIQIYFDLMNVVSFFFLPESSYSDLFGGLASLRISNLVARDSWLELLIKKLDLSSLCSNLISISGPRVLIIVIASI